MNRPLAAREEQGTCSLAGGPATDVRHHGRTLGRRGDCCDCALAQSLGTMKGCISSIRVLLLGGPKRDVEGGFFFETCLVQELCRQKCHLQLWHSLCEPRRLEFLSRGMWCHLSLHRRHSLESFNIELRHIRRPLPLEGEC